MKPSGAKILPCPDRSEPRGKGFEVPHGERSRAGGRNRDSRIDDAVERHRFRDGIESNRGHFDNSCRVGIEARGFGVERDQWPVQSHVLQSNLHVNFQEKEKAARGGH